MVLSFGMIKLSITFYYRRIFLVARATLFDWITKVAIAIVLLWTIACLFAFIFSCGTHVFANCSSTQDWLKYYTPSNDANSAFIISDLITDVMVLALPLPIVSTKSAGLSPADTIAKVIDLEPPNDDWKKNRSYWHLSDRDGVSGYLRDCKWTRLTELLQAPLSLQL